MDVASRPPPAVGPIQAKSCPSEGQMCAPMMDRISGQMAGTQGGDGAWASQGASAHKLHCQDVWLAVEPLSTPPTLEDFSRAKGATVWDAPLMWNGL